MKQESTNPLSAERETELPVAALSAATTQEITGLTDDLIDHVQRVRRQSQSLLSALDEASQRIADLAPGLGDQVPEEAATTVAEALPAAGDSPPELRAVKPIPVDTPELSPVDGGGESAPEVDSQPALSAAPEARGPIGPGLVPGSATEDILIEATRLAVRGQTREEIADALHAEFGVDESREIVDHVLGPPDPALPN